MQQLSAQAEDYLEYLYMREVEGGGETPAQDDRVIGELLRLGYIVPAQGQFHLTPEGRPDAESAVRRHRLAERLLQDVINIPGKEVDAAACEFEHSLHRGLDEQVCTLLGHPTACPHGRPIPPGRCCRERKDAASPAVVALATMKSGERGAIAYLASRHTDTIQKLLALGVVPGASLTVIQHFPSLVFQVGQTQVAIDAALATDIFIRRSMD